MSAHIQSALMEIGAIQRGHFVLSSGFHSDTYIQCARLNEHPTLTGAFCKELSNMITRHSKIHPDIVVSPAMGGLFIGYEIAKALDSRFMFCERVDGKFMLRRGFNIKTTDTILIVEDVITTGKSSLEVANLISPMCQSITGIASIINRKCHKLSIPVISLLEIDAYIYHEDELPKNLRNIPPEKPGSRHFLSEGM